jgi:hypothetical protein
MKDREPQRRVSISLPVELVEWARETAEAHDLPISTVYGDSIRLMRRLMRTRLTHITLAMNEGVSTRLEDDLRSELGIPDDQDFRETLRDRFAKGTIDSIYAQIVERPPRS